jgi:hypothetical protein
VAGSVTSMGFVALKLISILAEFVLSGQRVDAQFVFHDHPLTPGEIKLGMSNAVTGQFACQGTAIKQDFSRAMTGIRRTEKRMPAKAAARGVFNRSRIKVTSCFIT